MPTVEVYSKDLENMLDMKLPKDEEQLNDLLAYVKGEVKLRTEEELNIEIKDSSRADLWGVEGLARALRGFLGIEAGLKNYSVAGVSDVKVKVSSRLRDIRPYIGCAVLKHVELTDLIIRSAMHLQDKLDQTYGRHRRRTSIGLYNFDLIVPPLSYGVAKPDEVSFVPLEFAEKLTLKEILKKHPKGLEYGHIVGEHSVWPLLSDSKGSVLSFPPVINSNDLGKITEETKNVLVEVTGTSQTTVLNTLNMVVVALADRGGKIYSADIHYQYGQRRKVVTPRLETKEMKISLENMNEILGFKPSPDQLPDLLGRAGYGLGKTQKGVVTVVVPCYRIDVMHPTDVIEDIAIAHGYNRIKPRWQRLPVTGGTSHMAEFVDLVREIMIGLGYQEVLTFIMTNPENLQTRMQLEPQKVVEVANPRMTTLTCLRNWLLPSLLEFLSHNTHVEYPQRIFEAGYAVVFDEEAETKTKDVLKLACVSTHSEAGFSEAKSNLEALLLNLGLKSYEIGEDTHLSFIEGRTAAIYLKHRYIGVLGELHPQVLNNWGLKNPAAGFEINIDEILR